jgi:glutathione peroxidase-family protein
MKILITILFVFSVNFNWNYLLKTNGYHVGEYAMDFNLKNIDGKVISMASYNDAKGFIIAFTCNTCPFSILYEKRIIALSETYTPRGFPLIAINPNDPDLQPGDSYENMQHRARDKKYPFPYLQDGTQEVTRAYGATNTPHLFILKKVGDKYQVMYIGTIDNNPKEPESATRHYIDEAMNEILTGQPVKEPETKAVGCGIKWKM